jgi:hypothetical protein
MSITNIKNYIQPEISNLDPRWDEAIFDAKEKIRKLRNTIAVYKARKQAGDVWPGSQLQTASDETASVQ